jgi:hypothetical protein
MHRLDSRWGSAVLIAGGRREVLVELDLMIPGLNST